MKNMKRKSYGERRPLMSMHPAVCDSCHTECEVPFKPNGKMPVYCHDCFQKAENYNTKKEGEVPEMHPVKCTTCGHSFEVPFRPSGMKPIYCKKCFAKEKGQESRPLSAAKPDNQLDKINAKLDMIIKMLSE